MSLAMEEGRPEPGALLGAALNVLVNCVEAFTEAVENVREPHITDDLLTKVHSAYDWYQEAVRQHEEDAGDREVLLKD